MKAFVTGATGFVGSHVARILAEQGADLRLLVRSSSDPKNIQNLNAERVTGDLRDPNTLETAISGCDVVFHVAADYRLWIRDPDQMYRSNVEGTRAILEAARKNRVRRVVYTSIVATMGFTSNGHPANEDSPVAPENMIGHYKRSKFMAEQVALDAGRKDIGGERMDVVVVNPTTPVGEQDIKPTPTGRIIVDFLKKKFPAYVDTGLNLVDVRECARGHVAALEKGRSGERYILGGENLTLKQILDKLSAITGLPSPKVRVPYAVALLAGVVDEMVTGRILRREPRVTIEAVQMSRKKMFVTSGKAVRELGWKVVPVKDALGRAVEWFRANGYANT
ncbi:MAG: dihydroflavonol 4-reductase [Acidobacteria bacterium]|nr:MAG: dihydroflavonol 4-reductase [Acidobacteriota bacterium]